MNVIGACFWLVHPISKILHFHDGGQRASAMPAVIQLRPSAFLLAGAMGLMQLHLAASMASLARVFVGLAGYLQQDRGQSEAREGACHEVVSSWLNIRAFCGLSESIPELRFHAVSRSTCLRKEGWIR